MMGKDQNLSIGCEIEARPEGDGFEGAWFKAILMNFPKKSAGKKAQVSFMDLKGEDGSLLRETLYRRFIRPIPPENLFSTAGDFEEGTVLEANHRDGWWTCVFVKKLDEDKHLVYCDSPPDLIQFKRKQLREHYDCIKEKWFKPQNKQLSNGKSRFSCGTMVEVMEKTNDDVVCWIPSVIVKEMDDGKNFVVKSCKYLSWNDEVKPARTVSSSKIRSVPALISVKNYDLREPVEVFIDPGWRQGTVKNILCGDKYTVWLNGTDELLVFQHSDIRPVKESVSEWFMSGEPSFDQGSGNEMVNDVRSGTSDITATPKKQTQDKAQGNTSHDHENQNDLVNDSARENESNENNNRKRKREQNLSNWPFEKKLSMWDKVESMEAFKTVPQTPHFIPLVETEEVSRESSAIGMMFLYSASIEEAQGLQYSTPVSRLKGLRDSFVVLEKNGFDVKAPQSRIHKLLSLKDRQTEKMKGLRGAEKEIAEKESEMDEIERKILELQKLKEEANKETAQMKSRAATIDQELEDVELQFQTTVSAPW